MSEDKLKIAGKDFSSRLLVGTGKYKNEQVAVKAIEASGAEIVTVAIRRVAIDSKLREECILNYISPEKFTILPNPEPISIIDFIFFLLINFEILNKK